MRFRPFFWQVLCWPVSHEPAASAQAASALRSGGGGFGGDGSDDDDNGCGFARLAVWPLRVVGARGVASRGDRNNYERVEVDFVRDRWARRDVLLHAEWAALCQLATAAARGSPAGASSVAASGAAGANGGGEGVNASGIGGGMVRALSRRLSWLSPSPPPPPPRSLPLRLPPEPFVGVIPGTVVLPAAASAAGALLGAVTATFPPSGAGARGAPASPAASKAGSGAAADATSVGLSLVTYAPALPALCLAHHLCSERGAPPLSALAQAAVALLANDRLHCLSLFFGVGPSPRFQPPVNPKTNHHSSDL